MRLFKTRIESKNSVKLESRTGPFIPFVLSNTGLADHFVECLWCVKPLNKFDLDEPVRLTVPQLDPRLRMPQILIKIKAHFTEKFCGVLIRP